MANTTAAKKAFRSSIKKNVINNSRRNRIRTFMRKVNDFIKAGNAEKARESLRLLESEIMRGVTKKVIKLNAAARKLRRLSLAIHGIKK